VTYPDDKRATPEAPIHDLLARRFSPRAFAPEPPAPDVLRSLFSAAAWAPSSGNGQPWRFVVGVTGDDVWPRVLDCLDVKNQDWAKAAPVLCLGIAQMLRDDKPLRTGPYDLGQSVAHLSIQATAEGLYVHQMAGFSPERARATFAIADGFDAIVAFAIGPIGDPDSLPDDLRERELRPRTRRPLSETVTLPD
jgi:nitroreductase